jgi:DNA-binding CsgD family transcriptional regulator
MDGEAGRVVRDRVITVKIGQTADVGDIGWEVDAGHAAVDDISWQNGSLLTLVRTCTAALNAVTSPLLAVQIDGDLLFGNSAAVSFLRQSRWLEIRHGRLISSSHSDSTPLFASAMALLGTGVGSTVLLTDRRNGQQAVATVAPISFRSSDEPAGPIRLGLVWLTTSELELTAVTQLSRLFNLTRAEEHLLTQLVAGTGVREAAAHQQISIHTARNQLKSILHKTGRHSQTQLLTLVARMASLQLPESGSPHGRFQLLSSAQAVCDERH